MQIQRRHGLKALGLALAAGVSLRAEAAPSPLVAAKADTLDQLVAKLASAPRRRDFKSLPMILTDRATWDSEALDAVLSYSGGPKMCWDNTEATGPWLNVMRNSMNAQIWSFKHPDYLCVSATHGSAQLALYDDAMWEKYQLAKLAGNGVTKNRFAAVPPAASHDPADFEAHDGAFSSAANSIKVLQDRGAVFLACHNAAWELSERLNATNVNPDKLSLDALCAELTNHLIPNVVMTPGAVGTVVELEKAGFAYAR